MIECTYIWVSEWLLSPVFKFVVHILHNIGRIIWLLLVQGLNHLDPQVVLLRYHAVRPHTCDYQWAKINWLLHFHFVLSSRNSTLSKLYFKTQGAMNFITLMIRLLVVLLICEHHCPRPSGCESCRLTGLSSLSRIQTIINTHHF